MYDFRGPNTHGCEMDKRARKYNRRSHAALHEHPQARTAIDKASEDGQEVLEATDPKEL